MVAGLSDLRHNDWDGSFIKAELAKESFLDRLKREREQATKPSPSHQAEKSQILAKFSNPSAPPPVKEDPFSRKQKAKFNDESGDVCEEEKLVSRLESFSDFWKDDPPTKSARPPKKIRNSEQFSEHQFPKENSKNSSLHATKSVDGLMDGMKNSVSSNLKPHIDANSKSIILDTVKNSAAQAAELKRLKALEEKSKAIKQQKDAIKSALSSIDHAKPSNKIIFDDDGDPVSTSKTQPALNKYEKKSDRFNGYSKDDGQSTSKSNKPLQLFGGEEDENDNWQGDFRFKKQFEGKKGRQVGEQNFIRFYLYE